MFRSEQGVIPGSEPQNYDDILRKQKVFSQCTYYCLHVRYVCPNFYIRLYLPKSKTFLNKMKKEMWLIGKASAFGSMVRRFDPQRNHFEIIYNEVIRYHRGRTI